MYQLVLMIHVIVAVALIGLILIQHGKGADIGASFGAGASNTVFGSQGTGSFLFRVTGGLALTFFATSLLLSYKVSADYRHANQLALPAPVKAVESKIPVPVDSSKKDKQQ